jgi:hypothetical protein
MKHYIIILVTLVGYLPLYSQTRSLSGTVQKSNVPVTATLKVIPSQKKTLSVVDTSSFVAIPTQKQSTPFILPTLIYSSANGQTPDTTRVISISSNKSLYPVKNVTIKKE